MGTVRRHIYIDAPADVVWGIVGAPDRLHEWFPIDSCEVVGNKRWINLPSGLRLKKTSSPLTTTCVVFSMRLSTI